MPIGRLKLRKADGNVSPNFIMMLKTLETAGFQRFLTLWDVETEGKKTVCFEEKLEKMIIIYTYEYKLFDIGVICYETVCCRCFYAQGFCRKFRCCLCDGRLGVTLLEAYLISSGWRSPTPSQNTSWIKNIPTPMGKEIWRHRMVEDILSNEKYKGVAHLQKCYTVYFLSKKRMANEGEVPQYYVEGSHDAIIKPAEWQLVQTEIQKNAGRSHNCCGIFSAKLKCGDCGEYFGSKVWYSNSKYKQMVWQCNAKFKGGAGALRPTCTRSV